MTGIVTVLLAVGAVGLLMWMMRHASVLFTVKVQRGKVVALRGRAPKGLVRGINDIVRVRPVSEGILRVYSQGQHAGVRPKGDWNPGELQRLRNLLGNWPVAKIRAAPYRQFTRPSNG